MKYEDNVSTVFLAGFGDGMVKIFDRRLDDDDAIVRSYSSHSSWVQKVKWHPSIPAQYISARSVVSVWLQVHLSNFVRDCSIDGEVKLFDIRGSDRPVHTWDLFPQGLSAFDVHDLTGVFAA